MNLRIWLRSEWDRVAGFALVGLGALVLLFGYLGVKDSAFVAEQLAYIASGGLGGLFCLGSGVGLLLSADLHDEWRKLDRIEAALRGEPLPDAAALLDLAADDHRPSGNGTAPAGPAPRPARDEATQGMPIVLAASGAHPGGRGVMALNWADDGLRRAMALSAVVLLAPAALMTAGWRTASQTTSLETAAAGVGVGVLGLAGALVVIGLYTFWLRARAVGRKQRLFGPQLLMDELAERLRRQPRPAPATVAGGEDEVLVATGSRRFHRAGCASLAGLETTTVDRGGVDARLAPCGLCGAR